MLQGEHPFHDLSILASQVEDVNLVCQLCAISTQAAELCRKATHENAELYNQSFSTLSQTFQEKRHALMEDLLSEGSTLLEKFDNWSESWARTLSSSRYRSSDPAHSSQTCPRQGIALILSKLAHLTLAARLLSCMELAGWKDDTIAFSTGSIPISTGYLKDKINVLLTTLSTNARTILER